MSRDQPSHLTPEPTEIMKISISPITTPVAILAFSLVLAQISASASGAGPGAPRIGVPKGRPLPTPPKQSSHAVRVRFNQLLRESPGGGTAPVPSPALAIRQAQLAQLRANQQAQLAQLRANPNLAQATHGSTPQIRATAQQAANLARNGQNQVIPIPRNGATALNRAQQNQGNP
jgi:hypothetical protein